MKKSSIRHLEGLTERGVRKNMHTLKHPAYRERNIESIVKRIVPTESEALTVIANKSRWLTTMSPETYYYNDMEEINNAIASNLLQHLTNHANSYMNEVAK
jgi:hypothetical protein